MPLPEAAAGAAVLTLYGLAPLVWSNAIVTEVYALASLLLWSALYAAVRARAEPSKQAADEPAWAAAAGVLLGLGTGAHRHGCALGGPALAAILLAGRSALARRLARGRRWRPWAWRPAVRCTSTCRSRRRWTRRSTGARLRRSKRFWAVVSGEIYRSRLGGNAVGVTAVQGDLAAGRTRAPIDLGRCCRCWPRWRGGPDAAARIGRARDGDGWRSARPGRSAPSTTHATTKSSSCPPWRWPLLWAVVGVDASQSAGRRGRGRRTPPGRRDDPNGADHDGGHSRHGTGP